MLTNRLYQSYTQRMKTAISMPDYLFSKVEKESKKLNLPRSTFIVKAIEEYFSNHSTDSVTERLNEVYAKMPQKDLDEIKRLSDFDVYTLKELTKNDEW